MDKLVSIITPNYNGAEYIADTIKSVKAQTYPNWEMIIVDDCSTDESVFVIGQFSSDHRIKLIKQSANSGTVVSRNIAIEKAEGNLIAFLDSDDLWMPEKLEMQVSKMNIVKAGFCFTSYDMISSTGNRLGPHKAPQRVNYKQLLSKCDIGCSTVMYDVDILGKQFFDEKSPRAREDYVLWLKIAKQFPNMLMCGIEKSLMLYRKHNRGISANKPKAVKNVWVVYRDFEKLGLIKSVYYIIRYSLNGIKKHYF